MTSDTADDLFASDRLMDVALREYDRGRIDDARGLLEAVLILQPDRPDALLLLADVCRSIGHTYAEAAYLSRLNHVCPGDADLLCRLTALMSGACERSTALAAARQAVALSPTNPEVITMQAKVLRQFGHWEEAVARLANALGNDPEFLPARLDLAMLKLSRGMFAEAWPDFELRHEYSGACDNPQQLPQWKGEPFPGKRLLVMTEGGHGDNVWAARFIRKAAAMGGGITLQVRPAVRRLFESVEGVEDLVDLGDEAPRCDLSCPILSLPGCLKIADPADHAPARLKPVPCGNEVLSSLARGAGDRIRVGIIWSGSETYANNRHRAARLKDFLPLLTIPEVQIVSLQKGSARAQLSEQGLGSLILESDDGDFAETAALIQMLDLVIMTDTAVAHIAGSLGKPVWVLLDSGAHWYYGMSDRCPWYPSMRLFRQATAGSWREPMTSVVESLRFQCRYASAIE
jgi:Tfp pilus assembly protein PilF